MQFLRRVSLPLVILGGLAACATPPPLSPEEKILVQGYQNAASGSWDQSIQASTKSLETAKDKNVIAYSYSSRCAFRVWKGEYDAALDDCNNAIRARPDFFAQPYAARGRIFAARGQYKWALGEFDTAIERGDTAPDLGGDNPLVIAFGGKARVYATSPDESVVNPELAVKFAKKAVDLEWALSTPAYKILNRDTLAAAYAAAGRFDDAVGEETTAIDLLKEKGEGGIAFGDTTLLQLLSGHLALFERRQPLRGATYY